MITFESVSDYPNGYSLSEAEFEGLSEIMATDRLYYDWAVTECRETKGPRFLVVEKRCPKYEYAHVYFRLDADGSWGVLFNAPAQTLALEPVTEAQWKQEFAKHEGDLLPAKRPVIVDWDDPFETPSEAIERINREYLEAGPTQKLVENVKRIRAELPRNGTVDESEVYYSDNHHRAMILLPGEKHLRRQLLIYVTDVGDGEAVSAYVKSWAQGVRETEIA